ncbi:MAG: methyltransferase domain-containing protein [Nitrospinae bacterium]|nr:methyltransferase domain-containing protein [Nitrospinota bacterium]
MKRQVWAFYASIVALILSVAARAWNRGHPMPMPYFMRWILFLPRGPNSPQHLDKILEPRSGERILEIGPGIGVHALQIAAALLPGGILDALDVQQEMLGDLCRRAAKADVTNIVTTQGDAQALPYPDHMFDAAYMIGTLGEIPDGIAALRELRRVLKVEGRLVVGEVLVDPDYVPLSALKNKAEEAGFVFERTLGPRFCYFVLFRPAGIAT